MKTSIPLEYDELIMLDGKVNSGAQAIIDSTKLTWHLKNTSGLSDSEAIMANKIIESAKSELILTFNYESISKCPCCGREDGYWPVKRSTRWKRRGDKDYDNPKRFRAWSINPGFIVIRNNISLGWCESCKDRILPVVLNALAKERVEVIKELSGEPPKFKRYHNRACECGWVGHEGEMKWEMALMGDGKFPSRCPKCGAGGILDRRVKIIEGYTIVEAQ